MKPVEVAVISLFAISPVGLATSASGPSPQHKVERLNQEYFQTFNNLNVTRFDQIVVNDAAFTRDSEEILNKKQVQANLAGHETSAGIKNVRVADVKVSGNTGVATGRFWVHSEKTNRTFGFTNVFIQTENGDWKLVTSSTHKLP